MTSLQKMDYPSTMRPEQARTGDIFPERHRSQPLKVLHLNQSDIIGGAARAAYRIHHALRAHGFDSQMLVNVASAGDWTVQGPTNYLGKVMGHIRPQLAVPLCKMLRTGNPIIHSPALVPSTWPRLVNASDADIVHLHWVQGEMLSIADIGLIRKPIVWTLHDMWGFCGAEHYTDDFRWRDGYRLTNRPSHESGFDLNRWTWLRKHKHWRRKMDIVANSNWLGSCAKQSVLFRCWPVHTIHYPLDTSVWAPVQKLLARKLLRLPAHAPLVLFGAMGGGNDPRKGFDLLLAAMEQLRSQAGLQGMQVVVFGQLTPHPHHSPNLACPIHYTGHLQDDLSLRTLYSACDLLVVPSRLEAFGQTASEASACGTPVVAFNTGGLPDIVEHLRTGYLATPYDPGDLAHGISWVLECSERRADLGRQARQRAERLWNPERIAGIYAELYREVLADQTPQQ